MNAEVHGLREFHLSPLGRLAARLVGQRLTALWPDAGRREVAGLGFAAPFLHAMPPGPGRRILLTPSTLADRLGAVVAEAALPLPDRCLDGIVLAHALEACPAPRHLLRECWRVLRDDGRLLVVAPNRLGPWALFEHTPFGQGRPYSPGQVSRLLESQMFRVERRDGALFHPPFPWPWALRGASLTEAMGRRCLSRFAGVLVLEAEKDLFAAMPAGAVSLRRRVVMPVRAAVRSVAAGKRAPVPPAGAVAPRVPLR